MKFLLTLTVMLVNFAIFSQESEERLVYLQKHFPEKQLEHNANIFVEIPYWFEGNPEGPYTSYFTTDADEELVKKMKTVLLKDNFITAVSFQKVGLKYKVFITSTREINHKKWAAGLFYSIGFESVSINNVEFDIADYVKNVRFK